LADQCSNLRGLARVNCDIAETVKEKVGDVKDGAVRLFKSLPSRFIDALDPSGGLSTVISGGVKSFKYLRTVFGKSPSRRRSSKKKSPSDSSQDKNSKDTPDQSPPQKSTSSDQQKAGRRVGRPKGSKNKEKILDPNNYLSKISDLLSSILFEIKIGNPLNTSSISLPNFNPFVQAIQKNTTSLSDGFDLLGKVMDSEDEKREEKNSESKNVLEEKERSKSEKNKEKVIKKLGKDVGIVGKPKFFNPIVKIMGSFQKSFESFFKFYKSKKDKGGGIFSSLMTLLALQFGPSLLKLLGGIGKSFSFLGSAFKLFFRFIKFGPLFKIAAAFFAIRGAIEGFKEGGILGAIKGLVKGLLGNFVGGILDFGKNAIGFILGIFGLGELKEKLNSISFEEKINEIIDIIFDLPRIVTDFFTDIMGRVRRFFGIGEGTEIDEKVFDDNPHRISEDPSERRRAYDRVIEIDSKLETTERNIKRSIDTVTALNEFISQETNPENQTQLIKDQEDVAEQISEMRAERARLIEERKAQSEIHGGYDIFGYENALVDEIQTSSVETFDRSQSLMSRSLESTLEANRQLLASTDASLEAFMMAIKQIDDRMKTESEESMRQTLSESRDKIEAIIKDHEESRISLIEQISEAYEIIGTESPDFRNIQLEAFNLSENLTSNLEVTNQGLSEAEDRLERLNQMFNNPELEHMRPALQIGIDSLQNAINGILEERDRIERELDSFAIPISFTPYSSSVQSSIQTPHIEHLGSSGGQINSVLDFHERIQNEERSNINIRDVLLSRGYDEEELAKADIHDLYAELIRKDLERSLSEMVIPAEFETQANQSENSNTSSIPEVIILPPLVITANPSGIYDDDGELSPDTQEIQFLPARENGAQNIESRSIFNSVSRSNLIPSVIDEDQEAFRVDIPQEIYPLLPITGDFSAISSFETLSQSKRENDMLESERSTEQLRQMNINNSPVIDASTQNSIVSPPPSPVRQPPNSHDIFYGGSRSQLVF